MFSAAIAYIELYIHKCIFVLMINDMIRTNIKFKFYKLQNYFLSTCLALNKKIGPQYRRPVKQQARPLNIKVLQPQIQHTQPLVVYPVLISCF